MKKSRNLIFSQFRQSSGIFDECQLCSCIWWSCETSFTMMPIFIFFIILTRHFYQFRARNLIEITIYCLQVENKRNICTHEEYTFPSLLKRSIISDRRFVRSYVCGSICLERVEANHKIHVAVNNLYDVALELSSISFTRFRRQMKCSIIKQYTFQHEEEKTCELFFHIFSTQIISSKYDQ